MKKIIYMWSLVCIDQVSKRFFVQSSRAWFLSFFPPVWNSGSAWSLAVPVWLSVGLWIVMIAVMQHKRFAIPNSLKILIFAWILGNMIDRILYGAVRDFLWIGDWFPVFNLADVYMCVGIWFLIYQEWKNNE